MPSEINERSDKPATEPTDTFGRKRFQKKGAYRFITFFIFSLIVFVNGTNHAFAETYVGGHFSSATTWTQSGSPYIVTTDIIVSSSSAGVVLGY